MNDNLKLPEEKRHLFAQPLDTLLVGTRKETISKIAKKFKKLKDEDKLFIFHIVGDIVAQDFLSNEFLRSYIKICIIDEKTQRNKIDISYGNFFEVEKKFPNPKGIISEHSWEIIKESINSGKKTLLNITEGEEDLLVLPLIANLPINENVTSYVFYGQPPITSSKDSIPEGIVMVEVTERIKKIVSRFINLMNKKKK
jgi:uncharacterized protein (UPF0218 family)